MHKKKAIITSCGILAGHNACTAGYGCGGVVHHLLDAIHGVDRDASTSYKENISSPKRVIRRLCSEFLVGLVWRTGSNNRAPLTTVICYPGVSLRSYSSGKSISQVLIWQKCVL